MRNMETIGATLTYEPRRSDVGAALLVFDARVDVVAAGGGRVTPAADLEMGPREILTSVLLPAAAGRSAYESSRHPATLRVICGVAASVRPGASGAVGRCAFAVAGATERPVRLPRVESALLGRPLTHDAITAVVSGAAEGLAVIGDADASSDYRAHLVEVHLSRALARLARQQM